MPEKSTSEKVNLVLNRSYLHALQERRKRTGESLGLIVERALKPYLNVTTPAGIRNRRGRKPKRK